MNWDTLGAILTFDGLFSGFVGAIIGGLMAIAAVLWQSGETARHNLRAVVTKMGVHVIQCKGDGGRTEPWTVYMDEALSAFNRYRAFVWLPSNRKRLDQAWISFQGTDPDGTTPFSYAPTAINIDWWRADNFLRFLDNRPAAKPRQQG